MKNKSRTAMLAAAVAGLLMAGGVLAGSLDAPAAPTSPDSALYTLNDIYNRLNTGAPVAKRTGAFVNPSGGPTSGTTRTLDEIMALATNPPPVITAPAPVPKTGQTTSYAAGDDGAMQKGVSWPDPRFTDHADGTVTDHLTGLMWMKDSRYTGQFYGGKNFADALSFIVTINAANSGAGTFGHNDWRLPNINELHSLVAIGHSPALPPGHPFVVTAEPLYAFQWWSSTWYGGYPIKSIMFQYGDVQDAAPLHVHYVWPVRGGAN